MQHLDVYTRERGETIPSMREEMTSTLIAIQFQIAMLEHFDTGLAEVKELLTCMRADANRIVHALKEESR